MGVDLRHELVADLKRIASELGHTPSRREYLEHSKFSDRQYRQVFEGSYTALVHAAGLKPKHEQSERKRKFTYKSQKIDGHTVHTLNLSELFKKANDPEVLKVLVQPDTHAKFRDEKAYATFLEFARWYKPNVHLKLGDFLDCEAISHWPATDFGERDFVSEITLARHMIEQEIDAMKEAVSRIYLEGNHENWIDQAAVAGNAELCRAARELNCAPTLQGFLDLEKRGIQLFEMNHFVRIGKANFTHGIYTGDAHAKKHVTDLKASIFYGHLHDSQSYQTKAIDGVLEAASLGCLCRLDAKFLKGKPNNWVHGFGVFEFFPDGAYSWSFQRIQEGRLSYAGRVFSGSLDKTRG